MSSILRKVRGDIFCKCMKIHWNDFSRNGDPKQGDVIFSHWVEFRTILIEVSSILSVECLEKLLFTDVRAYSRSVFWNYSVTSRFLLTKLIVPCVIAMLR